ncbi:DNA-binding MurR/RpiR family transcriptional regulator [Desmospora profundinema]|uniref:DNA-binding MurR/RpiR family transcriptional regulator n=2 Tax=Desmospora profundinema TaxID=1571184 RepID=A0ABU1IJZ7_9BACL|nr:DNA-binding MurR/RpiR family transcriptional regulator [Desmospora profundinema]
MSKSHRKIAAYVERHPDTSPFLTAAKLAKKTGVSEATVVRFAVSLGYTGYTEMQRSLQERLRERLTTVERLHMAEDLYPEESRVAFEVLQDDLSNLKQTVNQLNPRFFADAVNRIGSAENIAVVAFRSSHSLGYFLTFYLDLILKNTELVIHSDTMFERLSALGENDLVIGIGFPRYTARTVQALQYARSRGIPTLALTDSNGSPLARESDVYLIASSRLPSYVDSFTAPLALINALLTAVGRTYKKKAAKRLEEMEQLWDREGIYFPDG